MLAALDLDAARHNRGPGEVEAGLAGKQGFQIVGQEALEVAVASGLDIVALVGEVVATGELGDDLAVDDEGTHAAPVGDRPGAGDDDVDRRRIGQFE